MIAPVRWNARLPGDTSPLEGSPTLLSEIERQVQDLAKKHNCTCKVVRDEVSGALRVIVDGSQAAGKKLLKELGATDVVEEP
jgi:hypothetical protein